METAMRTLSFVVLATSLFASAPSALCAEGIDLLKAVPEPSRIHGFGTAYVNDLIASGRLVLVDDRVKLARVQAITERILRAAGRPERAFTVHLVRLDDPNAMSVPGDILLVSETLVDELSEPALSWVIAHEVAHGLLRHGEHNQLLLEAMRTAGYEDLTRGAWSPLTSPFTVSDALPASEAAPSDGKHAHDFPLDAETPSGSTTAPGAVATEGGALPRHHVVRGSRTDHVNTEAVREGRAGHLALTESAATDPTERADPGRGGAAPPSLPPQGPLVQQVRLRLASDINGAYGQLAEAEADLHALLFCQRAGIPLSSALEALDYLLQHETSSGAKVAWSAADSHPTLAQRMAAVRGWTTSLASALERFDVANDFCSAGAFEAADETYSAFLRTFPQSPAAWTNRGFCALQAAALDAAPPRFALALPLQTTTDQSIVLGTGDLDPVWAQRARSSLERALLLDPGHVRALSGLAELARRSGDSDAAQALMDRALVVAPADDALRHNQAVLWADAGRRGPARKVWRALARAGAKLAPLQGNLARLDGKEPKASPRVDVEPLTLQGLGLGDALGDFERVLGPPDQLQVHGTVQAALWRQHAIAALFAEDRATWLVIEVAEGGDLSPLGLQPTRRSIVDRLGPPPIGSSATFEALRAHAHYRYPEQGATIWFDAEWRVLRLEIVSDGSGVPR